MPESEQKISLKEEATHAIEEARMILPGIQALFGFQLIAVFNERFEKALSSSEQGLHLAATCLVALAAALLMTPAAFQRQAERGIISGHFVNLASRLICAALLPLAAGLALDIYLIARLILHSVALAGSIASVLWLVLIGLWFLYPRVRKGRKTAFTEMPGRRPAP
ncbi:DUF6328 family protein [Vineibacter terrae]|uniref:DUF6328 family protein n=1 Tax=Vineibacter terrae TaxID=2586908 RepID=UPI002E3281E3|nr:DUF6328 family protein [Vineibacter terrae]HEX2884899.1 DUF6328 family protein [Vineibacter terrae]